jgi:hypothetical protein
MLRRGIIASLVVLPFIVASRPVLAHGFGERYDLPVPLNFFLVGAAATVAFSFVVIGFFVGKSKDSSNYPRYNLLSCQLIRSLITNGFVIKLIKALSVTFFVITLATSFFGENEPTDNFSPTFVWIIWWVGIGYITAFLGNVWLVINPWKILFDIVDWKINQSTMSNKGWLFQYPKYFDVWPGILLFFAFVWIENIYSGGAIPNKLGTLILAYSIITWIGMLLFGKYAWLRHGEAFSILFGLLSRLSPSEIGVKKTNRCANCYQGCYPHNLECIDCLECFEHSDDSDRQVNIRPYAIGLSRPENISLGSTIFVILVLASVTFDGLTATSLWLDFQNAIYPITEIIGIGTSRGISTIGLVMLPILFLGIYIVFSFLMSMFSGGYLSVCKTATSFVYSLIPIALAYHFSHYQSYLLIQGQYIIPLISDPFGYGWDIFGTQTFRVDISVINAKFVWISSVTAIVIGHIISVYIAHVISLRVIPDRSKALQSQYPMLLLMIFYTAVSLWIIAQPLV